MRRRLRNHLIGLGTAIVLLTGCAPATPATTAVTKNAPVTTASRVAITSARTGAIDRHNRQSVAAAFRDRLIPNLVVANGWNGNIATCDAGTTSPAHQKATLDTINWFRDFVGLTPVTFDPVYNAKAQKAALMMDANAKLSHSPPSTWACYSADGAEAASRSNIAFGFANGPQTIAGYIADPGDNNTAVGHRRWILDPTRHKMGSGTTARSNALWVIGATNPPSKDLPVVAWPPDGFFPVQLEPAGRWSLSIPKADFSTATVTVRDDRGTSYRITVHPVALNRGQNTLAWQVAGLQTHTPIADRTYTVTVSGIKGWTSTSHTYKVTMFDAPVG